MFYNKGVTSELGQSRRDTINFKLFDSSYIRFCSSVIIVHNSVIPSKFIKIVYLKHSDWRFIIFYKCTGNHYICQRHFSQSTYIKFLCRCYTKDYHDNDYTSCQYQENQWLNGSKTLFITVFQSKLWQETKSSLRRLINFSSPIFIKTVFWTVICPSSPNTIIYKTILQPKPLNLQISSPQSATMFWREFYCCSY